MSDVKVEPALIDEHHVAVAFRVLIELEADVNKTTKAYLLARDIRDAEHRGRLAERAAIDELRGMAGMVFVRGFLESQLLRAEGAKSETLREVRDALAALLKLLGGET